jgi:hypothetical protein
MKKKTLSVLITLLSVILLTLPALAQRGYGSGKRNGGCAGASDCSRWDEEAAEPTAAEVEALKYMHEEEKLARDVYSALDSLWDQRVFSNISRSEQRHMDAINNLLSRYGIDDSAAHNNAAGVFINAEIQKLYDLLTAEGSASLVAALKVGAFVEETDIDDLNGAIAETQNSNILRVYKNLLSASGSHLRAFVRQLTNAGVEYTPQVLTAELYESILADRAGKKGKYQKKKKKGKSGKGKRKGRGKGKGGNKKQNGKNNGECDGTGSGQNGGFGKGGGQS